MQKYLTVLSTIAIFLSVSIDLARADLASSIETLTGGRTKIVFAKLASGEGDRDLISPNYSLAGFDSYQGTFHEILAGPKSCANPSITPDGNSVIFSDLAQCKVYIVSWSGASSRVLVPGYGLCVQRDTATGIDWVYVSDTASGNVVYRYNIAAPSQKELIWNKSKVSIRFSVSADGRYGGGEFPWPDAGEVMLPNGSFKAFGSGCNAAIAPDNSRRFFHMEGEHRSVLMYDSTGKNYAEIHFDTPLGLEGGDSWIPRWSSDASCLTVTAPCGIPKYEPDIFLGRFNQTYDSITSWVRITSTPDTFENYAHAWIGHGRYMRLDRYGLSFTRDSGKVLPESQRVSVSFDHGSLAGVSASSDAEWLKVDVVTSESKTFINNTIDPKPLLDPGFYSTNVTVRCTGFTDEQYRVDFRVVGTIRPASLSLSPKSAQTPQGGKVNFNAVCQDQLDNPIAVPLGWSKSGGGSVSDSGVFTSNGDTGHYTICAWALSKPAVRDSATVWIYENPRITRPVNGTVRHPGDSLDIRWISHLSEFRNLMVYLSVNDTRSWVLLNPERAIYPAFDTAGRYSWLIPDSVFDHTADIFVPCTSSTSWIKVTDYSDRFEAVSEKPFVIRYGDAPFVKRNLPDGSVHGLRSLFLRNVKAEEMVSVDIFTLAGKRIVSLKGRADAMRIGPLPKGLLLYRTATSHAVWCGKTMIW
jgi:hypothetical protein